MASKSGYKIWLVCCKIHVYDYAKKRTLIYDSVAAHSSTSLLLQSTAGNQLRVSIEEINLSCIDTFVTEVSCCVNDTSDPPTGGEPPTGEIEKEYLGVISVKDPDNPKETILIYEWRTSKGLPCYTLDSSGDSIINNINDYEMFLHAGTVLSQDLAKKVVSKCLQFCLAAGAALTYQDIVDAAVAAGTALPSGDPPTGIINPAIMVNQVGQIGYDAEGNPKKSGAQYIDVDGIAVNASQTHCPKPKTLLDEDCDSFIAGEPLDTAITNNTGEDAVFTVCACFIPNDLDDNDKDVTDGSAK